MRSRVRHSLAALLGIAHRRSVPAMDSAASREEALPTPRTAPRLVRDDEHSTAASPRIERWLSSVDDIVDGSVAHWIYAAGCAALIVATLWPNPICGPRTRGADRIPRDLERLCSAAREFRALHGCWPTSMGDEWADEMDVDALDGPRLDPWHRPYMLQKLDDDAIRFGSLGKDAAPGGEGEDADVWREVRVDSPR